MQSGPNDTKELAAEIEKDLSAYPEEQKRLDAEFELIWNAQKKYRTPRDKVTMRYAFNAGFVVAVRVLGED